MVINNTWTMFASSEHWVRKFLQLISVHRLVGYEKEFVCSGNDAHVYVGNRRKFVDFFMRTKRIKQAALRISQQGARPLSFHRFAIDTGCTVKKLRRTLTNKSAP